MDRLSICLWFDHQAEEAAHFYTSIFRHAKIKRMTRYGEAGARASGRPAGSVLTVAFDIDGMEIVALNGGPAFTFNEAASLVVNCRTQDEIDEYWTKLTDGGTPGQCGWLKDRFGVSWQVTPVKLTEMLEDKDTARSERVMEVMLTMQKLDLRRLEDAYHDSGQHSAR